MTPKSPPPPLKFRLSNPLSQVEYLVNSDLLELAIIQTDINSSLIRTIIIRTSILHSITDLISTTKQFLCSLIQQCFQRPWQLFQFRTGLWWTGSLAMYLINAGNKDTELCFISYNSRWFGALKQDYCRRLSSSEVVGNKIPMYVIRRTLFYEEIPAKSVKLFLVPIS